MSHVDMYGRSGTPPLPARDPSYVDLAASAQPWTDQGKLYLADVEDLFSRRIIGFAMGDHPVAELAKAALQTAVAVRGGTVAGDIFHSDRGSTYTADLFTEACESHRIQQSMGRTGSCLDTAAVESFFSTLEHELLSRTRCCRSVGSA